ncbi:MAG: matrixin family metalloprotease [Planctomycetes bacterium]|nr:matrixin family metalloprotease [Planctomycetota bacterium]
MAKARNAAGTTSTPGGSRPDVLTYPAGPIPSGDAVSATQIDVIWSSVTGADDYIVYWGLSGSSSWNFNSGWQSATTYSMTGLSADTSYEILAKARNASGATSTPGGSRPDVTTPSALLLSPFSQPTEFQPVALSTEDLQPIVDEAIRRWQQSGIVGNDLASLQSARVEVESLDVGFLGLAYDDGRIRIDDDAAGVGWNVGASSGHRLAISSGTPQVRVDVLTVVMHEFGHLLGRDHDEGGVMSPTISAGIRIGAELRPLRIGLDDHTTEATRRRDPSSFLERRELRRNDVDRVFRRQGLHVPKSYLNGAALNRKTASRSNEVDTESLAVLRRRAVDAVHEDEQM